MGARRITPLYTATDLDRSLEWYCDILGCELIERWEDDGVTIGAALSYGDVTLGLSQDDFQKGRDRQKGVGFRILLETNEDIDTLATGIQERGGELVSPPRNQDWGTREFAVADPDGFKITITSPMPSE